VNHKFNNRRGKDTDIWRGRSGEDGDRDWSDVHIPRQAKKDVELPEAVRGKKGFFSLDFQRELTPQFQTYGL
jgi:hypothetical protein